MTQTVLVLNGPNLNLLGQRQPEIYGSETLDDVVRDLGEMAGGLGLAIDARQSNHEGVLVDWLAAVAGSPAAFRQILVENPARLYGFPTDRS